MNALRQMVLRLSALTPIQECIVWLAVAAVVALPRLALMDAVPVALWSSDSASYVTPALRFLDGEGWVSNERRGPVYSMMIAACVGSGGGLWALVVVQHLIAAGCVLGSALVMRLWFGRAPVVPLALTAAGYGLYNLPVYLAHLVRVETLLLALLFAAFGLLAVALKNGGRGWAFGAGVATGLAAATKGLLGPYAVLAILGIAWVHRRRWRDAAIGAVLFLAGMAAPKVIFGTLTQAGAGDFGSESYAGIQFYGRVAQWTRLDGGPYPEIKAHIRPQVEEYRVLEKRDNNLVIKRLIVPRIEEFLAAHPLPEKTVDDVCRELAFEAIASEPVAFLGQAWDDLLKLLFRIAYQKQMPSRGDLEELAEDVSRLGAPLDRVMPPATAELLRDVVKGGALEPFYRISRLAWPFEWKPPILVASLALPLAFVLGSGPMRAWLLALAGFWYFNLLLFCTVGKPLNRYFSPFSPVMFWAMACVICSLWLLAARAAARPPDPSR